MENVFARQVKSMNSSHFYRKQEGYKEQMVVQD